MMIVITYWHWLIVGAALVILEIIVPTFYIFWFGIAAMIMAALVYQFPYLMWETQLVFFVVFSLLELLIWRFVLKRWFVGRASAFSLNSRTQTLVGRTYRLVEPITDGKGRIMIRSMSWYVRGPDLPVGTKVKILGADGATLLVESVENKEENTK